MSDTKKTPSLEGVNLRLPHALVADLRIALSQTYGVSVRSWPAAQVVRQAMAQYVVDAERRARSAPVRD